MMSETTVLILAVIACLIIAGLSYYAGSLLFKLKQQNQKAQAQAAKRRENIIESVNTIAMAVEQQQCSLSEAAIRICVLLDHLADSQDYPSQFPALHDLYGRIQHMPTHEAWKALPKKEKRKMELEREEYEAELETAILKEATQLKSFS